MYKKNLLTKYFSNDDISFVHPDIFFILNIYQIYFINPFYELDSISVHHTK